MQIKKYARLIVAITILIGGILTISSLRETDPRYGIYETTWEGKPAFGQLHRDGNYTFYRAVGYPGSYRIGDQIAKFPASDAVFLH